MSALLLVLGGLACFEVERAPGGGADSGPAADGGATDPGNADVARLPVRLAFPLVERELFETVVGVDHDPVEQDGGVLGRATCLDYLGRSFPHCYDEHEGSDYILKGGFTQMDAGSATVVAAADGVVVATEDGHYDRCHGDLSTGDVDCDGHDMVANSVILQHTGADGSTWRSLYWHLMTDSVAVQVGEQVTAGQALGKVGSSGYSSMPHLHFELQQEREDQEPLVVDPYAGPYSQEQTGWCAQGDEDELPGECP